MLMALERFWALIEDRKCSFAQGTGGKRRLRLLSNQEPLAHILIGLEAYLMPEKR